MIIENYELHDIHYLLVLIRAYPTYPKNAELINAVIEVLETPQLGNTVEFNIIRKRLRAIEGLDREAFNWVYVDNVYTYGMHIIHDELCYTVLSNGLRMMYDCARSGNHQRLEALADALHNIPIYFDEGRGKLKKTAKIEFSRYNSLYKTNLLKVLLS